MYRPAYTRVDDRAVAHELIDAHPFAQVVTVNGGGEPEVSHLPVLREAGRLLLHMARANPQAARPAGRALVTFQGPHAYVSPTWYGGPADAVRVAEAEGAAEGGHLGGAGLGAADDALAGEPGADPNIAYASMPRERRWSSREVWAVRATFCAVRAGLARARASLGGARRFFRDRLTADKARSTLLPGAPSRSSFPELLPDQEPKCLFLPTSS